MIDTEIPLHFHHRRATPFWNRNTVPQALLTRCQSEAGTYSRLSVMQGAVKYRRFANAAGNEPEFEIVIEAGSACITPPLAWYSVEVLSEETYFNIDDFAEPADRSVR
ncbi:DUF1971 domain-containing protein [uncultured Pluralibacter sp.]|uniref:DUF1971 domain-containing protein n=1 Tax=uncultured Pluralibacter sp. TaxID=1490864 RepID=UPI002626E1FC|nr:DUF1971 domain-containing protein [uncultured Pluralibacter sp.]